MSNVIRLSEKRLPVPHTQTADQDLTQASISDLVRTALQAQEIARRGIIIAFFNLERMLSNCRQAIAQIPAGNSPERRQFDQELAAIERAIRDARTIADAL